MRQSIRFVVAASTLAIGALWVAGPASAACTRLGFSVNDYGKEGPTRDAKELLDKYIAKWTSERGITKYTTGKKDVTCELFLNFIVFDEHTCKAEASVCWDGPAVAGAKGETAAATPAGEEKKAAPKAVVKSTSVKAAETKDTAKAPAPVETGSTSNSTTTAPETAPASEPAATETAPSAN